uniref:Regulatory protein n=1 Tax=Siphoviridae sp. ctBAZ2 TaxID=2827801 RepID=A0A8S5S7Q2_9CAUD|nr:MAG TPA: Regulatory protein [Siphoviridae sp. ctBAZ2]
MRTRTRPNQDIRDMLKDNGLTQWDLCKALELSEMTLYRRLRDELPEDQKQEYMKVIERLITLNA